MTTTDSPPETTLTPAAALAAIRFDARGLVPAIAQRHGSEEVLMLAWMNEDAVRETLATGRVTYWSRSRQGLWRKGETSGHTQRLVEMRVDCDGDTLLLQVEQEGPACHTGARNCFFRSVAPSVPLPRVAGERLGEGVSTFGAGSDTPLTSPLPPPSGGRGT